MVSGIRESLKLPRYLRYGCSMISPKFLSNFATNSVATLSHLYASTFNTYFTSTRNFICNILTKVGAVSVIATRHSSSPFSPHSLLKLPQVVVVLPFAPTIELPNPRHLHNEQRNNYHHKSGSSAAEKLTMTGHEGDLLKQATQAMMARYAGRSFFFILVVKSGHKWEHTWKHKWMADGAAQQFEAGMFP